MPRVVPDQKGKYETDELFKKLSQECDVCFVYIPASVEIVLQCIPYSHSRL